MSEQDELNSFVEQTRGFLSNLRNTVDQVNASVSAVGAALAEHKRMIDGLRFIVSQGRVGEADPDMPQPNLTPDHPSATEPPAAPEPAPTPDPPSPTDPTLEYSIVETTEHGVPDLKLSVNGIVQSDTSAVVQLGTLAGFSRVHMNDQNDWYGKDPSGRWTLLNNLGTSVTPIGERREMPKAPEQPPSTGDSNSAPVDENLTIVNGQLAINGVVQTDTANVVQVGRANGYTCVHMNSSEIWYGKDSSRVWRSIPASIVTPVGERVDPVINPGPVGGSGTKAMWARLQPDPNANYQRGNPPGAVNRTLRVHTDAPLWIDPYFAGNHTQAAVPAYQRASTGEPRDIPPPTYPYGYSRSLSANGNESEVATFWCDVERQKGVYHWANIDAWVNSVGNHPLIFTMYATPSFYQKYPGERSPWGNYPGIASPPTGDEGMAAYERFIRALWERYGSKIMGVETWNEPNFGGMSANSRWSPGMTAISGAPFFSGTVGDLAKMQLANFNACKGTSMLAMSPGWADAWGTTSQAEMLLNASTGQGQAKQYTEAFACHHYDYEDYGDDFVKNMLGYRDVIKRANLNVDIYNTETGAEVRAKFKNDEDARKRAPRRIQRWGFAMMALGFRACVYYAHFNRTSRLAYLGDPIANPSVAGALATVHSLGGKVIREAAELVGGRIWLRFDDNTEIVSL